MHVGVFNQQPVSPNHWSGWPSTPTRSHYVVLCLLVLFLWTELRIKSAGRLFSQWLLMSEMILVAQWITRAHTHTHAHTSLKLAAEVWEQCYVRRFTIEVCVKCEETTRKLLSPLLTHVNLSASLCVCVWEREEDDVHTSAIRTGNETHARWSVHYGPRLTVIINFYRLQYEAG